MAPSLPEYRLTPKAREDLEDIWLYALEKWDIEQANHCIEGLTGAFAALAKVLSSILDKINTLYA